MNDQEAKDYSEWSGFFAAEVVFYGSKNIRQMIQDLENELKDRQSPDLTNEGLSEYYKTSINEIEKGMRDVVRPIAKGDGK